MHAIERQWVRISANECLWVQMSADGCIEYLIFNALFKVRDGAATVFALKCVIMGKRVKP